jgi:hypothetical protein
MIAETRDPQILNAWAAHPDVTGPIGGPVDFSDAIRETAAYFSGDHGAVCFEWCAPRTYEIHVMLTTAGRGRWGIDAVKRSLALMMAQHGASHVWARVKPADRHIALFARWCGFREADEMTLYSPEPARWRIFNWRTQCPQS